MSPAPALAVPLRGRRRFRLLVAVLATALTAALAPVATATVDRPEPEHGHTGGGSGPSGPPGGKVVLKSASGLGVGAKVKKPGRARAAQAAAVPAAEQTLILYDTTGPYGWLGQAYATMAANLASRFGAWTAKPVAKYAAGDVGRYKATIYLGSTYDEPLPASFLADVTAATKPVVWVRDNIWQLTQSDPGFQAKNGWMWWRFASCATCDGDTSSVRSVEYRTRKIARSPLNQAGIMDYSAVDTTKARVLATAVRDDGTSFPWALRSGNLTYVGENPFTYFGEGDRMMIFADLLFDALAPQTTERHRGLLRLEDITPMSDPADLRAIADYLASRKVPFGFGVVPVYKDPKGLYNGGKAQTVRLRDKPQLVSALKYLQSKGGVMVTHGYTHQYSNVANPYNGISGDDFEFFRTIENPDFTLTFQGPVKEDSTAWATGRLLAAEAELALARFPKTSIWEFPHYAASVTDYKASALRYGTRWERSLYPLGSLTGTTPDYSRVTGQLYPYVVRDLYGQKVLPENLGNVEPEPFHQFPVRLPADIITDAERNLAVRDGFAAFYFHPFWDLSYLKTTVEGIQRLGYTFVSPTTL